MAQNENAVKVINELDLRKFQLFLGKIIQKLPDERSFFSKEEEEKLCSVFEINEESLRNLIEFCATLFRKAAFLSEKPSNLKSRIQDMQISVEHSEIISQCWSDNASDMILRLKSSSSLAPRELVDIDWNLGLTLAHSNKANLKEPIACVNFSLRNNEKSDKPIENHQVEFSKSELYEFFQQLETIQTQMDSLSG